MSYLGKISAIVSANTSDFSSKLLASGKEVASWARSLTTAINSASSQASSSLRGIYTEAQKTERALQAIQTGKISFKGFQGQNLAAAADRMRSLVSVTKEINNPLNQAARALERMPAAVQGGFLQAMKTAQQRAELIAIDLNQIASGKSSLSQQGLENKFKAIADRALRTADAVERLKTVVSGVDSLATGREVQFRNPEFLAEMVRGANLQTMAAATPGGNFSEIIARRREAADATAAAFARMEEAQLTLGGDVAGTTAAYLDQLAVVRSINDELAKSIAATQKRTNAAQVAADSEIALLIRREQGGKESEDRRAAAAAAMLAASRLAAEQTDFLPPNRGNEVYGPAGYTPLPPGYNEENARRRMASLMGPNIADEAQNGVRRIEAMGARVKEVKAALDTLPPAVTAAFIPAIQRAEEELIRLRSLPRATATEIMAADAALRQVEADARRAALAVKAFDSFGGRGVAGLNVGLDEAALTGYNAQMRILQGAIGAVASEARGPAVEAFDRLRIALATAFAEGKIDSAEFRAEFRRLRAEAAATVSDVGGRGGRSLVRRMTRAGDVGRLGVDRWSLGLQQLGFAIDDFMSSTGGIDQKIRAVSNNISQMAFVVGGTTGLFVALGITLTSQVALGIMKFINGGRAAEDMAKALNETLNKQKTLMEEVGKSFKDMGDSMTGDIFFEATQAAEKFRRELEKLAEERKKAREAGVEASSPEAFALNAEKNRLERELKDADRPGLAFAKRDRIQQIDDRLKVLRRDSLDIAGPPTKQDILNALGATDESGKLRFASRSEANLGFVMDALPAVFRGAGRAVGIDRNDTRNLIFPAELQDRLRGTDKNDIASFISIVKERMGQIQRPVEQGVGVGTAFAGTSEDVYALSAEYQRLTEILNRLEQLEQRKKDAVAGNKFLEMQFNASRNVEATFSSLNEAGIKYSDLGKSAQDAINRIRALNKERSETKDQAQIAAIDKEVAGLERLTASQRSAAEVIRTFADTVKRTSTDLADAVTAETESIAEKARRDAISAEAGINSEFGPNGERRRPGDAQSDLELAARRRAETRAESRKAEDEAARIRTEALAARREFEANINLTAPVRAERAERERLRAVLDSETASQTEKNQATEKIAALDRAASRRWEDSPIGRAFAMQADAAAAASAKDEDRRRQEDARIAAARRGRDIGLRPGELEAREATDRMLDLAEARDRMMLRPGAGLMANQAQANAQANRFAQEQMRGAAPAIFEMADAVQNAILQGPSRQALEVTDVSSLEGQRELNRLLRGDDASKNANIVELEKQNQKLSELVTTMKDVAQKMGIVLDL